MKKDHFFLPTTCSSKFKQQRLGEEHLDWTGLDCHLFLQPKPRFWEDLLHQRYNGYGPCMEILSRDSTTVSDRLRQWAPSTDTDILFTNR
ncbi:unnamed protein product [Prunus armeniaca]